MTIPTKAEVAKLYVATFNRAPDADGLDYWVNDSGLSLEGIAQSFFDQPETQALYPAGTSNESFVIDVYANLFNREPDTEGLNYWVDELDRGVYSKNLFIQTVINGALDNSDGMDRTILQNKTDVGLYYAEKGLSDVTNAFDVMQSVSALPSSVESAKSYIDSLIEPKTTLETLVGDYDIQGMGLTTPDDSYFYISSTDLYNVGGDADLDVYSNGYVEMYLTVDDISETLSGQITSITDTEVYVYGSNSMTTEVWDYEFNGTLLTLSADDAGYNLSMDWILQ